MGIGARGWVVCGFCAGVGFANPAAAQEPETISCSGTLPAWSLVVDGDVATLDYIYTSELTRVLTTVAEGNDWPVALTLIGRGDSAILIAEPAICTDGTHSARVLTQRGETPVLLGGCCQLGDR